MNSTGGSTPRQFAMGQDAASQHSISSLSAPPSNSPSMSTNQGPTVENNDELRRQLLNDAGLV